jgi:hypothetical protein
MRAVGEPPAGPAREAGRVLVPAGVSLTLLGVIGGLLARAGNPGSTGGRSLVVLSLHGNDPWNLVLLAGVILTAAGGIRWAARLGTELGSALATAMSLLLVAAVGLGTWSGWQARTGGSASAAAGAGQTLAGGGQALDGGGGGGGHVHPAAPALDGASAEGASVLGHVHGSPGVVTAAERVVLDRQLAAAKKATARYRDIAVARADGYRQVTQFIPGLGLHLANLGIPNRTFDAARPNVLLYMPNGRGGLELAGVAYSIVRSPAWPDGPPGFAGGSDVWHYHNDLCFLPGGQVSIAPSQAACSSRGGFFQARTAWLLHAWIWKPNPRGVFTEYNPNVF